jgi:FkbM family methyltransferase
MFTTADVLAALARLPLVGSLMRRLARRFPEGSVVAIRSGPAAGLRWRRYKRYINAYWAGTYELPVQKALVRTVRRGDVVFDVGASAGFFSVLAARLVGESGTVVAVEPLPANAAVVREQLALNHFAGRAVVEEVALSDRDGQASFLLPKRGSGKLVPGLQSDRTIPVQVTTLDGLCRRHGRPNVVKMDVEGAEAAVLAGGAQLLRRGRTTFIVELHGDQALRQVEGILHPHGYGLYDLDHRPVRPGALPDRIMAFKRPSGNAG